MPSTEVLLLVAGGVVTAGAATGYAIKAGRFLVGLLLGLSRVIEDWQGQPARDGEPERPSLPRRLAAVERDVKALQDVPERLRDVERRLDQVATATGAAPAPPHNGRNST